jgi:hypothetical protein
MVVDMGMVATPMLYYASFALSTHSGVMVTGSHNPPEYNGLKTMLAGDTLAGDAIQALRAAHRNTVTLCTASGGYRTHDIREAYLARIVSGREACASSVNIAVDCWQRRRRRFCTGALPPPRLQMCMNSSATWTAVFPNHHSRSFAAEEFAGPDRRAQGGPR